MYAHNVLLRCISAGKLYKLKRQIFCLSSTLIEQEDFENCFEFINNSN